jgi:hypothetical protein
VGVQCKPLATTATQQLAVLTHLQLRLGTAQEEGRERGAQPRLDGVPVLHHRLRGGLVRRLQDGILVGERKVAQAPQHLPPRSSKRLTIGSPCLGVCTHCDPIMWAHRAARHEVEQRPHLAQVVLHRRAGQYEPPPRPEPPHLRATTMQGALSVIPCSTLTSFETR